MKANEADTKMQFALLDLRKLLESLIPSIEISITTFQNVDGSVDGQLTLDNLPPKWKKPSALVEMIAFFSNAFKGFKPLESELSFGGRYWISWGARFGPKSDEELDFLIESYKRHRGLFQIGTYPMPAWHRSTIQQSLAIGLRFMVEGMQEKHDMSLASLLIRFIWMPNDIRPGRFANEGGQGK
jgi:hypothetical protein